MPRGGRREGAGRRRRLSLLERVRIGARCERLWRAAHSEALRDLLDSKTEQARHQWRKAQEIPIHQRNRWLKSQDGEDYVEDVRGAMQEDQGIDLVDDDADPSPVISVDLKFPRGERQAIIKRVSAEMSDELGRLIGPGAVDKCWKEFRRLERLL